jgi:UDP-glucose 4-epimerase
MHRVVVTGGAGFIGSHLARKLSELGYNVVVYDDLSNASGLKNLPPNVKLVKGDVLDFNKLKSVIKGSDIVFHLAVKALPMSFTRPNVVFATNDEGTYNVCRVCNSNKVKKLVYVSSSEVYGTAKYVPMDEDHSLIPTTVYAASKASGEMYVRAFNNQYGLPAIILRPFNTYGPFMRNDWYASVIPKFISRVLKGLAPVIYGDGDQTRDFTYVEDIVDGMIRAADIDDIIGETLNLARSEEVSVNKIAQLVVETCGKLLGRKFDLEPIHERPRIGDVRRHHADITKARKLLEFNPKVDLTAGLKRYTTWYVTSKQHKTLTQKKAR